ncbi:response regulator [Aneurinibacillus danicus]|uniref:Two-component system response regulator n=1 Tax=Aneurinibacillus danicus TaxID=267746 RepID=A0A511V9Y7_9BACL|nr:two-component system response regulator [Aneurinibacillus danicus]GEN35649.1 two-component system response regulator [Aneurinibacillus danicus]
MNLFSLTNELEKEKMALGRSNILIVDDEEYNLDVLEQLLTVKNYRVLSACTGGDALLILNNEDIDLILLDVMMPGMNGYEVLREIRALKERYIPVIMVTALDSKEDKIRALEEGSDDFLNKPIDKYELYARVHTLLRTRHYYKQLAMAKQRLENEVMRRTAELQEALAALRLLNNKLEDSHREIVERLSSAAEFKDPETAAHIQRISHYCGVLARAMDMGEDEVNLMIHASPMHDIGKIGVPDQILLKPGKLTPEEFEKMKEHTLIGYKILSGSDSTLLKLASEIALSHHEKYDGSGYPYGLSGEEIPLSGRIVAVVDVFDALTSRRPYKEPYPNEKAYEIIRQGSGTHFDPKIVELFFGNLSEIVRIQKQYQD